MKLLTVYVLAVVFYFAFEIGTAFLPGAAVDLIHADPHHCASIGVPSVEGICWAATESEAR